MTQKGHVYLNTTKVVKRTQPSVTLTYIACLVLYLIHPLVTI